jgi:hypothetical protein
MLVYGQECKMSLRQVRLLIRRHYAGLDANVNDNPGRIHEAASDTLSTYKEAKQYPELWVPNQAKLRERLIHAAARLQALIEYADDMPGRKRAREKDMALFAAIGTELGLTIQQLQAQIPGDLK